MNSHDDGDDDRVYDSNVALDQLPLSEAAVFDDWIRAGLHGQRSDHPFDFSELERYQTAQLLGSGGMGQVSAVTDRRLNRQVALKEVPDDASNADGLERRLVQEAWITAQLDHPGIVAVHDAGRGPTGRFFFTMRLIRGRSLVQALDADDLPQAELLRHFLAVCQAMAYAHARGVVHRDLKPGNLMLGGFGETQVMDWGLAQARDSRESVSVSAAQLVPDEWTGQTALGARVGTPAYMSPEQARAEPVGPASDVFSLGIVLFEILTGRPMFEGKTSEEIYAVLDRGSLPTPAGPRVDVELAAILSCTLEREPSDRYATAESLAEDIAAYIDGRRVKAHTYSAWEVLQRFGRTFRLPLAIVAAALVVVSVVFGLSYSETVQQRNRAQTAEKKAREALGQAIFAETRQEAAQRRADSSTAQRLLLKAATAMQRGHQPEAEVLAAQVLAHDASPWARGILARFDAGRRPSLLFQRNPRRCTVYDISPSGDAVLCTTAEGVSLLQGSDWSRRWTIKTTAHKFAFISDATVLAVDEYKAKAATLIDADTGGSLGQLPISDRSRADIRNGRILFRGRAGLRLWTEASAASVALPGPLGMPRCLSHDGQIAVASSRSTGELSVIDTTTMTATRLPGLTPVKRPAVAALNSDGSRLALGFPDGTLHVVST
ncbi:MAG: hypothetical protein ACI9OJ_002723, partial [Myxococcota bacterium]